jgi:hypothetical protein
LKPLKEQFELFFVKDKKSKAQNDLLKNPKSVALSYVVANLDFNKGSITYRELTKWRKEHEGQKI